jgi:hypothetical protein
MTVQAIFDRVLTILQAKNITALEQRVFFVYLNHALRSIEMMYPDAYLLEGFESQPVIDEITDPLYVNSKFMEAIVAEILYEAGAGEEWQSEFMRLASLAGKNLKAKRIVKWRYI